ncbi:MAG: peptide-modifying radical SAM enzyme CbpB [bacterium]|nr:peptide-modifying radical SAM enzyme CbpB [bacterium]
MNAINKQTSNYLNSGYGPQFQPLDIGHNEYIALINADNAFWLLAKKSELGSIMTDKKFISEFNNKAGEFEKEMFNLRSNIKPSAVYFNPTERCNLNCTYCYIPEEMRKNGPHMSEKELLEGLEILKNYFKTTVPEGRKPQIVFHGSEPLLNKEALFEGIKKYNDDFDIGIQTNATLLTDDDIAFIKENNIGIGISIDGPDSAVADRARIDWSGEGYFHRVSTVIEKLNDHPGFNVICTVTDKNMEHLSDTIDYFHEMGVKACMLNIVRCTQEKSRTIKPDDDEAAKHYLKALDRSYELYQKTGNKIIVANFANILIGILAPTARRLMCDISPCGGGRCFFAVAANGDMFPCSEFVGVSHFNGGNLYTDSIESVLETPQFKEVTNRKTENIYPCSTCAIQHFCGSPCPAEAYTMNGGMDRTGAFCAFYEEQVRYAFRLIADNKHDAFLFDGWDNDTSTVFDAQMIF